MSATSIRCCGCPRACSTRRREGQRALLRPQAGQRDALDQDLWIYDLRTNKHFTLKTSPLTRTDLDDFVACYNPANRLDREESERFHRFPYDELVKRDKASLDIFWLRDESMEDSATLHRQTPFWTRCWKT